MAHCGINLIMVPYAGDDDEYHDDDNYHNGGSDDGDDCDCGGSGGDKCHDSIIYSLYHRNHKRPYA